MIALVIGAGGREHALTWKIAMSPNVNTVFAFPGNAGIAKHAKIINIQLNDFGSLKEFCHKEKVDLVVVGPEAPLVAGIADELRRDGILVFGPDAHSAKMEGSKAFCRSICEEAGVKMAAGKEFSKFEEAMNYLKNGGFPVVIKADGLAAGKGVLIASNLAEAQDGLAKMMKEKAFGAAGDKVIIEEFLKGEEVSILAVCSGEDALLLEPSQDHKRAFDQDKGPNTGGMGAYSPVPFFTDKDKETVKEEVILPVLKTLKKRGLNYIGVLYAGLMMTENGIRVLEFNVRFGDPETQVVLPRLKSDLTEILWRAASGKTVSDMVLDWDSRSAITVVAASKGYPESYQKGFEISGTDKVVSDVNIFHAGTKTAGDKLVTDGGRVLNVSALGDSLDDARKKAYSVLNDISFEGMFYRTDIGSRERGDLK